MVSCKEKGKESENLVTSYLEEKGYKILSRNYSCRMGEIDIIGLKDNVLCFVEVKSLSSKWSFEELPKMVDLRKQHKIRLTATNYLNNVDLKGSFFELRFDVAAVTEEGISYFEGVF